MEALVVNQVATHYRPQATHRQCHLSQHCTYSYREKRDSPWRGDGCGTSRPPGRDCSIGLQPGQKPVSISIANCRPPAFLIRWALAAHRASTIRNRKQRTCAEVEWHRLVHHAVPAVDAVSIDEFAGSLCLKLDLQSLLDENKNCTHCACNQPISQFKRRSKSQGRLSWCRECINESARRRNAAKRIPILGLTAKYVRINSKASRVESVITAACPKAGGVEAFGGKLAEALKSSNQDVALNAAMFFMKLAFAAERLHNETLEHCGKLLKIVNSPIG